MGCPNLPSLRTFLIMIPASEAATNYIMDNISEKAIYDTHLSNWNGHISHGFFNRHGGQSLAPFNTNNVSYGVGDTETAIIQNRTSIKGDLGIDILLSAHQVHGSNVFSTLGATLSKDVEMEGFDALITNQKGVGLMIQQADCQALLLFDPVTRTIAAIHCGWRGNVVGIIGETIAAMKGDFGVKPENLQVVVSPSLGPCCSEFVHHRRELPKSFRDFQVQDNYFDFWKITRWQLEAAGVPGEAISVAEICTSCSSDYFSYRRARRNGDGVTGRNCSVIALNGV